MFLTDIAVWKLELDANNLKVKKNSVLLTKNI